MENKFVPCCGRSNRVKDYENKPKSSNKSYATFYKTQNLFFKMVIISLSLHHYQNKIVTLKVMDRCNTLYKKRIISQVHSLDVYFLFRSILNAVFSLSNIFNITSMLPTKVVVQHNLFNTALQIVQYTEIKLVNILVNEIKFSIQIFTNKHNNIYREITTENVLVTEYLLHVFTECYN